MSLLISAKRSLSDRALGAGVARLGGRAGPQVREPQGLGVDPQLHQLVAEHRVLVGALAPRGARPRRWGRCPAGRVPPPAADGGALVHQRGHRHPPAVAHVADAVGVGDADVGQVDLVELRLAGDLAQRPDLDARRVHVDGEVGQALVLRLVGVGAGDEHPAVGQVGHRVPHLLAVDHPLVAVLHRPGAEAGQVGAGARLAEQLAPDLLAREHRAQQAVADLVAAVGHDRGPGQARARRRAISGVAGAPASRRRRSTTACSLGTQTQPAEALRGSAPRPARRRSGRPGTPAGPWPSTSCSARKASMASSSLCGLGVDGRVQRVGHGPDTTARS